MDGGLVLDGVGGQSFPVLKDLALVDEALLRGGDFRGGFDGRLLESGGEGVVGGWEGESTASLFGLSVVAPPFYAPEVYGCHPFEGITHASLIST